MSWVRILLWLLPRRLDSSWVLLAVTSFGILAAVTLMSLGAIYSRGIAEGGLRHTLASVSPQTSLNVHVAVRGRPLGPADYRKLRSSIKEIVQTRLGYMLQDIQRHGRILPTLPLLSTPVEQAIPEGTPVGRPFFLTDFKEHSQLVEGDWPHGSPELHDRGLEMEVAVGRDVASNMGFEKGSRIYLYPFRDDPLERITLTIVGLVEPIDIREEYWMGISSSYFNVYEPGFGEPKQVPIYVSEESFFSGLGTQYSSLIGDYEWFLFLDTGVLTAGMVKSTQEAITGLETDINKRFPRSLVLSRLESILADFDRNLTHARVPLYLFISLVVVVILYFLAVVMGLLVRTRSDEASLLRSRGANMLQVGGLLTLGEGAVVILAMFLGPFLALGIMRYLLLGTINPQVIKGDTLSVGLSGDMFVMGAIGGLLSLGVLVASGMGLARLGMVEFLRIRARPPSVPLLHRYYIDLLVLAVLGLLWWQIHSRGGFIARDVFSRTLEVDPSLLMGPLLVLLAAAFLILRFLPLLIKALAWAGSFIAPAWLSFALVRVARDPLPHGSLTIILMMAAALGFFGATFQSTLSKSQREKALYSMGADLVVEGDLLSISTPERISAVSGVKAVAPIKRDSVTLLDWLPGQRADILVVDSNILPQTAWFRDDFAGKSLSELLRPLNQSHESNQGIILPVDAESIGIWVNLDEFYRVSATRSQNLWMRVSDVESRYYNLHLGKLSSPSPNLESSNDTGWGYFESPLPLGQSTLARPPFYLVSIFISESSSFGRQMVSINLDDVTVKGPSILEDGMIVEGYEEPGAWVTMPNAGPVASVLERTAQATRNGRFGLTFSWQESVSEIPKGIFIPPGPFPLPAIGGPAFRVGQELRIKDNNQVVPLVIRDVTNYFPTIQPSSALFLLAALEDYSPYINRISGRRPRPPGEFWVSLEDTADRSQVILSIKEKLPIFAFVRDGGAVVDLAQRNPLAGGGWNGLTILSVSTLTLAALLALGTFAVVSVHASRIDLTVVRALGFSRLQTLLALALERIVVAVLGIGIGSALGIWLGWWVLGFLDITASGQPIIPPMIVTFHGGLITVVLVSLVMATAVAILFAGLAERRLKAADLLRIGQ